MILLQIHSEHPLPDDVVARAIEAVEGVLAQHAFDPLAVFSAADELEAHEESDGAEPLAPDTEERYALAMEAERLASAVCGTEVHIGVQFE
ncbi:MAG: hypothetical protein J7556_14920 [Acidovorax sp.]|nr:hypothetical protein [Acidovorax sp.]